MLGIIPTVRMYIMRVCSADYILHYLHVTAAQLYSLSPLTSVGLSVGLHRNYELPYQQGFISASMSLLTQSLRLAGERAGRWNEVGDMYHVLTGMCSHYHVVIVTALLHLCRANNNWLW